jgi:hypothetical protein
MAEKQTKHADNDQGQAGSAESAAIQQCFSLIINQRTVLSVTIIQRNEQADMLPLTNRVSLFKGLAHLTRKDA